MAISREKISRILSEHLNVFWCAKVVDAGLFSCMQTLLRYPSLH